MSADNYVGVYPRQGGYGVVNGCMSILDEDCKYRGSEIRLAQTRELALVAAHDYAKNLDILEYGVIELDAIPDEFCGRCFVCINERKIVDPNIERCDECHEPFTNTDWRCSSLAGTFHHRCEPRG